MPKKFASLLAPACFAFLLFAAAGSASAQADPCDPATDPNQCVVTGGDPDPTGPHAIVGGPVSDNSGGVGNSGDGLYAVVNKEQQSAAGFYALLLMLGGVA